MLRWEPPLYATSGTEIADLNGKRFVVRRTAKSSRAWETIYNQQVIATGIATKEIAKAFAEKHANTLTME